MQTALIATYTAGFKRIVVKFFDDDSAEVSSMGDVTDEEENAAVEAGGAHIAGWESEIQ
jgi:hypothetical protein